MHGRRKYTLCFGSIVEEEGPGVLMRETYPLAVSLAVSPTGRGESSPHGGLEQRGGMANVGIHVH